MDHIYYFASIATLIVAAVVLIGRRYYSQRKAPIYPRNPEVQNLYRDIQPLANFDWQSKDQIYNAPFKDTYHLTMAIQSSSMSEFLDMDKTYRSKILLRRHYIETKRQSVMNANPVALPAIQELYSWIFGTYLPNRLPTMFTITSKETLYNHVFEEHIPLSPPSDPFECLKTIGSHVDDDIAILLPTADPNGPPTRAVPTPDPSCPYHLHAFILCFPSGFNTPLKFGLPLAGIHAPVPGYKTKLEKSMDRFFATLPFGKIVKRANWAVQDNPIFFHLDGTHSHTTSTLSKSSFAAASHTPSAEELTDWAAQAEKVKVEDCHLRSERQTLHRLEETGAIVFAFKTYLYTLGEVKGAGLGAEMADAVEGLWRGGVPAMAVYKKSVVWGEKVVAFLRS